MTPVVAIAERRTSADEVFDYLYDEILSLRLLPGAKISEAEIAARFDVSRQPVRDAFSRLANLDLVLVRPQRATEVKRFSSESVRSARFVRAAVETEVIRLACKAWDGSAMTALQDNLDKQAVALAELDIEAFHTLDYQFHKLMCSAAKVDFAFDVIAKNKALVDRLCVLSLMHIERMTPLLADHRMLLAQVAAGDEAGALDTIRTHLARLDSTVASIKSDHAEYFED